MFQRRQTDKFENENKCDVQEESNGTERAKEHYAHLHSRRMDANLAKELQSR